MFSVQFVDALLILIVLCKYLLFFLSVFLNDFMMRPVFYRNLYVYCIFIMLLC